MNTLRNGDWVGESAEVFYAEMDSVVMPALGRLVAALDQAAHTTLGIREVMAQAELDVAAIFRERDAGGAGKGKGLASANMTLTTGDISDPPVDFFDAIRRWLENILNPKPTPTPTPSPAPNISATTVSVEEAEAIFQDMADEPDIAFNYPPDGCYSRAHLMSERIIERYGIIPQKVWAQDKDELDRLDPKITYGGDAVRWWWHVAPVILVQQPDGSFVQMVIDPSITAHPVTLEEWKSVMSDPYALLEVTNLGQPPHAPNGQSYPGTGYWLAKDPPNLDDHAKQTMEQYKKLGNLGIW